MADAKEAGAQDDDRTLGIMEKIRTFMNFEVIPRITGLKPGVVQFKWGSKDTFNLEFPPAIKEALEAGVINTQQAQIILETEFHWKFPSQEEINELEVIEPTDAEPVEEEPIKTDEQSTNEKLKKEMLEVIQILKGRDTVNNE
jgi:hypothetical protein